MYPSRTEIANYLITYYPELLSATQMKALKHYIHSFKLEDMPNKEARRRFYIKTKWLSEEPEVLKLLDGGYNNFVLACAEEILRDKPNDVFINLCPVCGKLARTPYAKQCRYCGHDWH